MITLVYFFSEGLTEEVSLRRAVGRQECVVEREVSREIIKLRVDGGCAINVCEVAAAVAVGAEWQELESILGMRSCVLSM
jgi:hypothetical protein